VAETLFMLVSFCTKSLYDHHKMWFSDFKTFMVIQCNICAG
jgi:hypothetical protein